jgi:hypothetical protein
MLNIYRGRNDQEGAIKNESIFDLDVSWLCMVCCGEFGRIKGIHAANDGPMDRILTPPQSDRDVHQEDFRIKQYYFFFSKPALGDVSCVAWCRAFLYILAPRDWPPSLCSSAVWAINRDQIRCQVDVNSQPKLVPL